MHTSTAISKVTTYGGCPLRWLRAKQELHFFTEFLKHKQIMIYLIDQCIGRDRICTIQVFLLESYCIYKNNRSPHLYFLDMLIISQL